MSETENQDLGTTDQEEPNQEQTAPNSQDEDFTGDDALGSEENSSTSEKSGEEDASTEDALGAEDAASEEKASGDVDKETGEDAVPETYSDFDLPEGISIPSSYMDKLSPIFKELGITQAGAQKLIDAQVAHVQEGEASRTEQVKNLHKEWLDEAKADKELGGDNFDTNLKAANAAVNQFGSPELKTLLKSTGMGMHPEVIRVFSKIGGLLQEDVPGSIRLGASTEKRDTLSEMYPDDVPNANS